MDPGAAKALLLRLESLALRRRGPLLLPRTKADVALLTEMARTANRTVEKFDEHSRKAPDPWHAALYLLKEVQACGFLEPSRSPGAPLFRGQRRTDWRIDSSLLRQKNPKDIARGKQLLGLFCRCLEAFEIEETPAVVKPDSYVATAQHYGMLTPYLDFTVDPLIAVYFACSGAGENEPVVVYLVHFNDAHFFGARVLVPPPWVRRLHRQKGLFLHYEGDEDLRKHCRKVVFPAAAEYTAWVDGREPVLPETKWFSDLCRWIATGFGQSELAAASSAAEVEKRVVASCGEPPFLYDSLRGEPMKRWFLFLDEMAEWLALRASGPDSIFWDCIPLIRLVQDNPGWYRTFQQAMKLLPSLIGEFLPAGQSPNQQLLELWHQIERCLQENDRRRGVWDAKRLR